VTQRTSDLRAEIGNLLRCRVFGCICLIACRVALTARHGTRKASTRLAYPDSAPSEWYSTVSLFIRRTLMALVPEATACVHAELPGSAYHDLKGSKYQMIRHERSVIRIPLQRGGGDGIQAWFYRPAGPGPHPIVVMGHGLAAVRAGRLAPFAERFRAAGLAVVVIDYRHWGGSDGTPRDVVNVRHQREDYQAAITWASAQPELDADRIFIWGTSFSGLHVTALAASDIRIAGAVAQCPLVDGLAGSLLVRPSRSIALFCVALLDRLGSLIGREPIYLPVTVAPGAWGLLDTVDAKYGQELLAPREPADWHNRIAARSLLGFPMQRPVRCSADIQIPFPLVVAESDTQTPVDSALTVADRAPRAELRRSCGGHYDVYEGGQAFTSVVEWEVEFLRRHAGLQAVDSPPT
jgi:uncharacterized protein